MIKIVFATNNEHKLSEIRAVVPANIYVLSLQDIGCHADIPETADTLEGNAMQKARYVWDHYHTSVFADDTGLEVDALNGRPGVYSARYAGGKGHDSEANMTKLLAELEGQQNRSARFRTVIALILDRGGDGEPIVKEFEGEVKGSITTARQGASGFGYDPIFQPEGRSETFAEMGAEEKNKISHRARAVARLTQYLETLDK